MYNTFQHEVQNPVVLVVLDCAAHCEGNLCAPCAHEMKQVQHKGHLGHEILMSQLFIYLPAYLYLFSYIFLNTFDGGNVRNIFVMRKTKFDVPNAAKAREYPSSPNALYSQKIKKYQVTSSGNCEFRKCS